MTYTLLPFRSLSLDQLYALLQLRQEVFVVEQDCPYLDADGKDQSSHHLLGTEGSELLAYVRIVPPGVSYEGYAAIGRVVTAETIRGQGIGHALMQEALAHTRVLHPDSPIKISAQSHLQAFYGALGFVATGKEYLEDDIPHRAMIWKC